MRTSILRVTATAFIGLSVVACSPAIDQFPPATFFAQHPPLGGVVGWIFFGRGGRRGTLLHLLLQGREETAGGCRPLGDDGLRPGWPGGWDRRVWDWCSVLLGRIGRYCLRACVGAGHASYPRIPADHRARKGRGNH